MAVRVCALLLYIYFGLTSVGCQTVTVVVEQQQPSPLWAGTNFSLVCTALTTSSKVSWKIDERELSHGTDFLLHRSYLEDNFEREKYSIDEKGNSTATWNTLTLYHVTTDRSSVYTCFTSTGTDGSGDVTGNASIAVKIEDAQILANKSSKAVVSCEGVEVSGVTVVGAVTWDKMVSDVSKARVSCGVPPPATTSTATSTTTSTPNLPTTAAATTAAALDTATATPAVPSQNTTGAIARRSAERMHCDSAATISIDNLQKDDEATYTCSYKYKLNGVSEMDYSWKTVLLVKVEPLPPSMPWQVNSDQYDAISLRWNASEETLTRPVDYYVVEHITLYSHDLKNWRPENTVNSERIDKNIQEYKITGLEQSTEYVARVLAYNVIGATESDTNEDLKTAASKPMQPHIYQEKSQSTTITLEWSVQTNQRQYDSFFINFFQQGGPLQRNVTVQFDGHDKKYYYTFTNLTPSTEYRYTEYCYTIQSVKGNETSDAQNPCRDVRTDINGPDAPTIANVTTLDIGNVSAAVTVYFDPPNCIYNSEGCLHSYILEYRANGTGKRKNVTFGSKDTLLAPYNLSGLHLGFWYEIRLAGQVESMIHASAFVIGNFSQPQTTELFENVLPTIAATNSPNDLDKSEPDPVPQDQTLTIVIVCVCVVLAITFAIVAIVMYRKRQDQGNVSIEMDDDLWIDLNTPLLAPATMGYVENAYENINIDQWAEHCREMHANSDIKFTEEYESICQTANIETTWKDSLEPANQPKNRYNNIVAYDHSRVVLRTLPGVVHSDYINANYLDSYDRTRSFIATQGPLPNTIDDFWRMIWENNCNVIVMITNVYEKHKKKCEQYWPDSGSTRYGQLSVSFLGVEEFAHWTIRRFTVKNNKVSKKKHQIEKMIVQYHYTEWPDHGIPEYTFPVLSFVKRACASNTNTSSPIVVHCSAGVGRTGTFIVLEAMMKQIKLKRTVNVQCFLRHIRSLRNHMVQTEDQYIFIHDALLHFIESAGRTDIPPKKFRTMIDELDINFDSSGETIIEKQYKTIVKWSPSGHLTNSALLDVNQSKNRDLSFIPLDNSSRVKLPKVAGENGSDYINGTYLHGHFLNREFIITQHPSAKTEYDFWRMVWDQNSMTIVMLSNIGQEDLITFFRPKGEPTDWAHKSSFKLTFAQENLDMLDYAIRDFQIESTQDDYEMLTRMFSITCWPEAYAETESYAEGVFQFIEVVNKWHATKRNQTGPIIVIDKNGGKVAAQFCALYTLYNQYHNDNTIDIYSLAYLYHMKRPGIWESQEDYRLLYNSMLQLCTPPEEEDKLTDGNGCTKGDYAGANTYANVRRINTIPRSPEHMTRTDTL